MDQMVECISCGMLIPWNAYAAHIDACTLARQIALSLFAYEDPPAEEENPTDVGDALSNMAATWSMQSQAMLLSMIHAYANNASYEMNRVIGDLIGNVAPGVSDVDASAPLTATPATTEPPQPCPVCLDALHDKERVRRTTCGHYFCDTCISQWLESSTKCPICMADLEPRQTSGLRVERAA
jgi:hypothetical protein